MDYLEAIDAHSRRRMAAVLLSSFRQINPPKRPSVACHRTGDSLSLKRLGGWHPKASAEQHWAILWPLWAVCVPGLCHRGPLIATAAVITVVKTCCGPRLVVLCLRPAPIVETKAEICSLYYPQGKRKRPLWKAIFPHHSESGSRTRPLRYLTFHQKTEQCKKPPTGAHLN